MNKLTTEEFIGKAIIRHGNKYDYSKTEYKGYKQILSIVCPEHGEFRQFPGNHLRGANCPECSRKKLSEERSIPQEEFIQRAEKVFGDRFDYSKVEYKNLETNVTIICKKHNTEFEQMPGNHLSGQVGCPKCKYELKSFTQDGFISKSKEKFGDRFDYSKVEYKTIMDPVILMCKNHGEFTIIPGNHLRSQYGCPICGAENGFGKSNKEIFIKKAIKAHGDRYDYSKIEYVDSTTPVKIICPIHGEFEQQPVVHTTGYGCPKCHNVFRLEETLKVFFDKEGVSYEEQKSWPWLKYKNLQRVDFYLPEYNIAIECQGVQHFEEKPFFKAHCSFEEQKLRDQNKLKLCTDNGIKLFYFSNLGEDYNYPYKVYDDVVKLLEDIKTSTTISTPK